MERGKNEDFGKNAVGGCLRRRYALYYLVFKFKFSGKRSIYVYALLNARK